MLLEDLMLFFFMNKMMPERLFCYCISAKMREHLAGQFGRLKWSD